ncbi:MAG: undecaprenyldiphospho-muramoylpentapeptide beta-N-acetylglucosaminyltransferase [Planctomycetota bacterium]|nr:undecaprenyldiphospho-muramoylpentapeptide beta-N-acetylglucosaminyltransferase [Planctomycetota bacterium]
MRLVIAGGGTGGHLFPGIALAEELLSQGGDHAVLFMGARGGLEERIIPRHSYRLELLPSLKGGFLSLTGPRKLWRACKGYLQARRAILSFRADAVVGLGGYASALPVLAGWGVEVPCMLLEQNVIPGRTTRLLARFAAEIGVQFPEAARRFPNSRIVKHVGNPLRRKVLEAARLATQRNTGAAETSSEPTILVVGGSQGARALNDIAVRVWPKLKQIVPGARMVIIAGRDDDQRTVETFAAAGGRGQLADRAPQPGRQLPGEAMEDLYAQASVVLARAGATTMAELTAFALPSVLVPYPFAADNHQVENARVFVARGAGWMMVQKNIEIDRLAQRLADAILQPERRRRMAMAASSLATPQSAVETIARLAALVKGPDQARSPLPPAGPSGPARMDDPVSGVA